MNFKQAIEKAKKMPSKGTDPTYEYFSGKSASQAQTIIYKDTVYDVFFHLYRGKNKYGYYVKNGKLYYHKKYARLDTEIKNVTYEIIGIKRKTTHLPAGVIINNIKFS